LCRGRSRRGKGLLCHDGPHRRCFDGVDRRATEFDPAWPETWKVDTIRIRVTALRSVDRVTGSPHQAVRPGDADAHGVSAVDVGSAQNGRRAECSAATSARTWNQGPDLPIASEDTAAGQIAGVVPNGGNRVSHDKPLGDVIREARRSGCLFSSETACCGVSPQQESATYQLPAVLI
jgi:hypothetical protein